MVAKKSLSALLLAVFIGMYACLAAGSSAARIDTVQIQDTINPGVQDYLEYAIDVSRQDNAECLIILLDTPGGLMSSMRGMVEMILNSPVPIIVYVYPSGAQAASAGVLITVAADIAAMAPGTNIGAAHPVTGSGGDIPSTMGEKVLNDMVAFARSITHQRGRNEAWVEDAIRKSVSVTADEALKENVIDLTANDIPDLLRRLDGWELRRAGAVKVLHTQGAELRDISPGWRHRVLRALANPNISYILLLIGLAGLYFELSQPGAIFPGVIGAISLILAFYSMQTLPVNYAGFLFIILAMVLFILEIKVASYGMLSLAGIISLVLGSLMLYHVPGETTGLAMSVFIPSVAVISAFFVSVASLAFRAQKRKVLTGVEGLQGKIGVAKTPLAPEGKVFVYGELWNATADEPIEAGEQVQVVSVENLKLKVKRISVK